MVDPNSFKAVVPETTNQTTNNQTIIDVGKNTQDIVQKVGAIGVIVLAIIVVLTIILIIKKKGKR